MPESPPLLELREVSVEYGGRRSGTRRSRRFAAVDGVSLVLERGETLGVVGESGAGKSTLARAVVRLVRPSAGQILVEGDDVTSVRGARLRALRRKVQLVFQNPYGAVDPRMRVGEIVAEPLVNAHHDWSRAQVRARVLDLLGTVGLPSGAFTWWATAMSGGQLQRVVIARALAVEPSILVADEPVSSLDVSVQAQVLNVFQDLKRDAGIATLFITHNLAVVQHVADRIAVLFGGHLVETGSADDVLLRPMHPYTKELIAAVPRLDRQVAALRPDPRAAEAAAVIGGCPFRSRCPEALPVCADVRPSLQAVSGVHLVACHAVASADRRQHIDDCIRDT